jgi:hypothetical protein
MTDLPIDCTLNPTNVRRRGADLLPGLFQNADSVEQIEHGFRLRFFSQSVELAHIASVIETERECSRFLRFNLSVSPDFGPLTLDVTGPVGTSRLLSALVAPRH